MPSKITTIKCKATSNISYLPSSLERSRSYSERMFLHLIIRPQPASEREIYHPSYKISPRTNHSILTASIAWTRTTSLYLPFPTAIPATGTFLPMLTLLIPAINTLYNRSSSISKSRSTRNQSGTTQIILVPLINALLVILPTIIITLSTTYLVPSDTQICSLERTWQAYFHNKNAPAIRTIQDTLQCCGLRSTRDRAWPFKDGKRYGDDACEVNLGYRRSCLAVWGQEERGVAGLVVGSVVVVFVMKVCFLRFLFLLFSFLGITLVTTG